MEKAYFPMTYYRLTQGYGNDSTTHKTIMALDLGGKDSGIDEVYAPYTGTIMKCYSKKGVANTIWFQSNEEVLCANNEQTFLTILLAHDDDISKLKPGMIIKQGEVLCHEGKSGTATGNHVHLELSNKKFSGTGWHKNKSGEWQIDNPVKPEEYLFLKSNQIVLNNKYKDKIYTFKVENNFYYLREIPLMNSKIYFKDNLNQETYQKAILEIKDWIEKS